ncbi:MAG TPA: tyrosine-type recombinase/integrase, partial [Streptosporangiaceae bacterium]|nr:tyrosine-type recombinase/integrase [Streptosporangiaceae bacterium]
DRRGGGRLPAGPPGLACITEIIPGLDVGDEAWLVCLLAQLILRQGARDPICRPTRPRPFLPRLTSPVRAQRNRRALRPKPGSSRSARRPAKGIRPRAGYTVQAAVDAWFEHGLPGRSAKTLSTYREVTDPVLKMIGGKLLTELTAAQVRAALTTTGRTRSSRTVQIAHRCLVRAIDHAQASDLVSRNVAALVSPPQGKAPGRASKSLTVTQARQLVHSPEAKKSRLYAYILLCLTTGIRTEEARALRWTEVDWARESVAVYRSVRARGDVKTPKSRRKITIPTMAADALELWQERQEKERIAAGPRWKESGLVFTSRVGTALDAADTRRTFKDVCEAAGLGRDWTPRELRTSFVSVMSASGASIEQIARLVGHSTTTTTEGVYRKQIDQAAIAGPEILDTVLKRPTQRVIRKARSPSTEGVPGDQDRADSAG